jgi:hypothetical protein
MSVSLNQSLNKYLGKTRMESLMERIKEANNILDILSKENTKINNTKTNPINFINKIEKMLTEINLEKDKSKLNNEKIDEIISLMPEKGLNDISFSKQDVKKEKEKLKLIEEDKINYRKKLEDKIVNQRLEIEKIKKEESETLTKISRLEDEIRLLKEGINFNMINIYQRNQTENPVKINRNNLRYSMLENNLERNENEKQMFGSKSYKNINNFQDYNFRSQRQTYTPYINELWSNRNINNDLNNLNQSTSAANIRSNMRRVTPIILNNSLNIPNQNY